MFTLSKGFVDNPLYFLSDNTTWWWENPLACHRQQGATARAERDGTRAESRFRLSPKRTSPLKSVGGVSSVDCWQPRCAHQLE